MKTSEILSLSLQEFDKNISIKNRQYIIEVYKSILRAFMSYKEKAELCTDIEYLGINEYFDIDRENSIEYKEYLKELFAV